MAELFVSYASADRDKAKLVAERLMHEGYSVWWDRTIPPGRVFDEVIQEALNAAKCVIVLWSAASVRSNWVKTEAAEAAAHDRLVPAFIERVEPPIEFKRIQAADLSNWDGEDDHPELNNVLAAVRRLVQQPGSAGPSHRYTDPALAPRRTTSRAWLPFAAVAIGIAALVGGILFFSDRTETQTPVVATSPDPAATPAPSTAANPVPAPAKAVATGNARRAVNLLSSENGGELLVATHPSWTSTVDGREETYAWVENGSGVYGFKDGRAATFDSFAVLIPEQSNMNLRDFELLVGNDSPTGEFHSIGQFATQNLRMMKQPFQEFHFAPVTAKYFKVHSLKNHSGANSAILAYEFRLLGRLE
jgi:hypothetical protein